jgi:hypothetical protein
VVAAPTAFTAPSVALPSPTWNGTLRMVWLASAVDA